MMTGLKRPLRAGDRFPVTLIFARAGKHVVEFLVSPSPPNAPFSPMKM
jgi:copper(I)-binding protein